MKNNKRTGPREESGGKPQPGIRYFRPSYFWESHCGNDLEYFKARALNQHVVKQRTELSTFDQCVEFT